MSGLCAIILGLLVGAADEQPVSFSREIAPIVARRCLECHNDRKSQAGLNLKTFALLRRGGKGQGAEILQPGDPEASGLIEVIRAEAEPRMPYKQSPLSDAQIATLERWVREGARFDGPSETETEIASLVDPLKDLPNIPVRAATSDPARAVAFTPDGSRLAVGVGKSVQVFDVAAGKLVATFEDHPGPVTSMVSTPDGTNLIACGGRPGQFGSVVVHDLASRSTRLDLRGHKDIIQSAAISPDGSTLATASYDRLVILWNLTDGKKIRTLDEHTDSVYGVAFSPDGRTLASCGADRAVKVWDVATGRKRITMSEATGEQYAVRFSADGNRVLAGGVDRTIRSWTIDGDSATLTFSAIAHDGPILKLVSADDKSLTTCGEDRTIKTWTLPNLEPRTAFPPQADWPLDIALNGEGTRLAVARYDGSVAILDANDGKQILALRDARGVAVAAKPPAEPPKPELVRNASLSPPDPRGATRGATLRVNVSGNGVDAATSVAFTEPGLDAVIVAPEKPTPGRLAFDLSIAPEVRVGVHRFVVVTPVGIAAAQSFDVTPYPQHVEVEPNDALDASPIVPLPATLVGTIAKPGDVDLFRFSGKAGQQIVFKATARGLGSTLDGVLTVMDGTGQEVAQSPPTEGGDPRVLFSIPADGTYALRVSDALFGGDGNHFYRINADESPVVTSLFPRGIAPGYSRPFAATGANLAAVTEVSYAAPSDIVPGTLLTIPVPTHRGSAENSFRIVAAEGDQSVETTVNDEPSAASPMANPGGISGRVERSGDVDFVRFEAKKGQRRIVEIHGRRLGSPIDPAIEILDADGKSIPAAIVRRVSETEVAFRDHASAGRSIRLTRWENLAVGDHLLIGRELVRLFELPRNPDDDAVMWGLGNARNNQGERLAFLGTTPEHHPLGQPIYKVEILPPDAALPPGGTPPVTLHYRNDDAGQGAGKDSIVAFDPPADGTYLVRVEDTRGMGGEDFGYHLVVRPPTPDFRLSLNVENANIPRGGSAIFTAMIERIDGFEGPVEVELQNLPEGVTATPIRIEREVYAADFVLSAAADCHVAPSHTWTAVATARLEDGSGTVLRHELDPGGPNGGWVVVMPESNLTIGFRPETVTIHPGEQIEMTLTVDRAAAFKGRVPIDVRNLPRGVRVLNIGLNGVLVTESQVERSVVLYAEPWAELGTRPFFAVGSCEAAGTQHASSPILLNVAPATAAQDGPG